MSTLDMREQARSCLKRANCMLTQADEYSFKYVCLELRFAIEYITYSLLEAYKDELPDDTFKKWQPKQLIDELLKIDPSADKTVHLTFGLEKTPGELAKEMRDLGNDERFSLPWVKKNYNMLGSFLHVPTLFQIESGKTTNTLESIERVTEIAKSIESVLNSPIYNVNIGEFYSVECICGRSFKRRTERVNKDDVIVCLTCKAIWDVLIEEENEIKIQLRTGNYQCPACTKINTIGIHEIREGACFECECGAKAGIQLSLVSLNTNK